MLHLGDMWPKDPPKRRVMRINAWFLLCLLLIIMEAATLWIMRPEPKPKIIVDTPKTAPPPEPRALCYKKNGLLEVVPGDIVICFRGWV